MSSSRHTRSSQRTPASVASKGKKKARTTEEPTPTPEDYIYRSGLCKNRFVQDFEIEKLLLGDGLILNGLVKMGLDFQEMFEFQGWGNSCEFESLWIKKADATPQKRSHRGSDSDANSEDEDEDTFTRTPSTATRTPRAPFSPPPFPSLHMESSSRIPPSHSHVPQFESLEASFGEIKEEQKKLGQQLEKLSLDMKTGFDDIKQLFAAHDDVSIFLTRM
ncbi:hypothetical protein CJ030_MR1G013781 [Morella rubra]|uniref:Uncharacterized protein n=1 Tax=Morella rubra TaxID=262757 RepID=A0A6A1WRH7_9ROSI|nr:hypothetical protein CJ030_MR1G013781 [Morella rubra]